MEKFELEKMAIEYCAQYGIADDSTHKADIINAFCVGAKIEREACAMVAENFDFNDRQEIEPPRNLPRYVAAAIRKRSNAELCGSPKRSVGESERTPGYAAGGKGELE